MEDIARLNKEANLAYYEMVLCKQDQKEKKLLVLKVKDIYLHPALFTVQSGLLSTSGVLMRQKLVGPRSCSFFMRILNLTTTFVLAL